jgi:tripartite-type tricarboxylate transporter receptor subunit TctC
VSVDLVLITNPQKVPATNLKEFVAYAQSQPVNFFGTPGPGTVGHFLSTMFADTAKTKVEPVHFKATGDSVTSLLSGDIHALFVTYTVAASLAKAGKVRALAVTGATRSPLFPQTPTVKEVGYAELEAGSWYGVFAPVNTPPDILDKLSAEIVKDSNVPEMRAKFEEQGMSVTALNRDEFARGMKGDLARWDRVVKSTGFTTKE